MTAMNRNSEEFFKLLMKSQKVIYAYILSMVHHCADADDIMQETLALMWERYGEFTPGTNFGAWGVKIARNKVLNFYQKKKSHSSEKFDEFLLNQIEDHYHRKAGEMNHRLVALQDCIRKLNVRDRKLISILYGEGMKITELALHLNRPLQGLYKVVARIHSTLRNCVNKTILSWDM